MKKTIALLMTVVMCLLFCCCGNAPTEDKKGSDGNKGDSNNSLSVIEETEFVLCQEWKNVKSGHSVTIRDDGTYVSGDYEAAYSYNEEKQCVVLDSVEYSIVKEYGAYLLVFNEEEYLVSAKNYDAIHAIFVKNGQQEIAQSGTILAIGDTTRLTCGVAFTLDKVELDEENTVLSVYLTCKNTTDEYCEELYSVKGNWTSLYLGCPFTLTAEDAALSPNTADKEVCLKFETTRLTAEQIRSYSDDSYGYFRLYFSAAKDTFYINIYDFFNAK